MRLDVVMPNVFSHLLKTNENLPERDFFYIPGKVFFR